MKKDLQNRELEIYYNLLSQKNQEMKGRRKRRRGRKRKGRGGKNYWGVIWNVD